MALPLVGFLALWVNLSLLDESRNANAVLLLVPLSLLAPIGVSALRRGAASAFDWFGRMTFTFAAALIWLGWYAMAFGLPAQIARNFARLGPGFTMPVLTLPVLVAVGASVLWLYLTFRSTRYPLRPLAHWCGGMTLLWALVMTLWLPWVEHVKSYRSVAQKIATHLPRSSDTGCVSGHRLGAPQQASLEYFLDRRLRTLSAARPCNFVITQGGRQENALPGSWTKRWEGARPGDRHERFRLYSRNEPAAAQ
jgi:4-amino-4-deoxy-L-arabinose transferase-like glycosyltransferase